MWPSHLTFTNEILFAWYVAKECSVFPRKTFELNCVITKCSICYGCYTKTCILNGRMLVPNAKSNDLSTYLSDTMSRSISYQFSMSWIFTNDSRKIICILKTNFQLPIWSTVKSLIYVAPNPKTSMFLVSSCSCLHLRDQQFYCPLLLVSDWFVLYNKT